MCVCVQIMEHLSVSGMEQHQVLPPPYQLPPPYSPRPVTCTVNMITNTTGGSERYNVNPTCHCFAFMVGFCLGMVTMVLLTYVL